MRKTVAYRHSILLAVLATFVATVPVSGQKNLGPPEQQSHVPSGQQNHVAPGHQNHGPSGQQNHGPSNRPKLQGRQYNQNQMMNMLDQVESGKPPALPARSPQSMSQQSSVQRPMRPMMGAPMGRGVPTLGHGMYSGLGHQPAMMGRGMRPMGALGGGAGMGIPGGAMGGGNGALLMQRLKQKLSSMQGGPGSPMGGAGGPMGGALGAMGSEEGQNKFLQQMLQHKSQPGGMGRAPAGLGGMPMSRLGGRMGMAPMMPLSGASMPQAPSDIIRPSATAGGASFPPLGQSKPAASTGNMSELERQMEQQYGH